MSTMIRPEDLISKPPLYFKSIKEIEELLEKHDNDGHPIAGGLNNDMRRLARETSLANKKLFISEVNSQSVKPGVRIVGFLWFWDLEFFTLEDREDILKGVLDD